MIGVIQHAFMHDSSHAMCAYLNSWLTNVDDLEVFRSRLDLSENWRND